MRKVLSMHIVTGMLLSRKDFGANNCRSLHLFGELDSRFGTSLAVPQRKEIPSIKLSKSQRTGCRAAAPGSRDTAPFASIHKYYANLQLRKGTSHSRL